MFPYGRDWEEFSTDLALSLYHALDWKSLMQDLLAEIHEVERRGGDSERLRSLRRMLKALKRVERVAQAALDEAEWG